MDQYCLVVNLKSNDWKFTNRVNVKQYPNNNYLKRVVTIIHCSTIKYSPKYHWKSVCQGRNNPYKHPKSNHTVYMLL